MSNRFEYIGSDANGIGLNTMVLFNDDGYSIRNGNPYSTRKEFHIMLGNATRFGFDQFINNVTLPDNMGIGSTKIAFDQYLLSDSMISIDPKFDTFWHDPINDCWITSADNIVYHIFK